MDAILRSSTALAAATALLAGGCFLEGYEQVAVAYGTVTISWAFARDVSASACSAREAELVRLQLTDEAGRVAHEDDVPCDVFRAQYVLRRGWYTLAITPHTAAGLPAASTHRTQAFYVAAGRDTHVVVDFVSGDVRP